MDNIALWLVVLLAGVWFFLLRTRGARLDSKDQFDSLIAAGQPVVVEFFSNA